MDAEDIAQNDAERTRLRDLISRLSRSDLRRRLDGDWTVSAALGHLAFWDRRGRLLLEAWGRGDVPRADPDWYSQVLNDALLPFWLGILPANVMRLVVAAAEDVDRTIESLSPATEAAIRARGEEWRFRRFRHRREHLDAIERALGAT